MQRWKSSKLRAVFWLMFFSIFVCIQYLFLPKYLWEQQTNSDAIINTEWIHPNCKCPKGFISSHADPNANSTCPKSWFRGPNQKVISYSFYGKTNSGYFKGVSINSRRVGELYPGWTVRLYHDIKPDDAIGMADLCREVCAYPNLDECYVGDITNRFKNIDEKFGMVWRFLAMGDPSVDVFGVRDLDSLVYQREVDAVNDWLKTDKTFHIMRDNPAHVTFILRGMWGAQNTKSISTLQTLINKIVSNCHAKTKTYDQYLLTQYVWPVANEDTVAHDSFLCNNFPNTRPWPSQRVNKTFVGDMEGISITRTCPAICRPPEHRDWIYC